MAQMRRSKTWKQFLLRVHPDHFHRIPKAHDENLQSMQLLNQFADDFQTARFGWKTASTKRVFFNVYVPGSQGSDGEDDRVLKRFSVDLSASVEDHMTRILKECGVHVTEDKTAPPKPQAAASSESLFDTAPPRPSNYHGMDFGFSAHFDQFRRDSSFQKRKRVIINIRDFFQFMQEPETKAKQQQRQLAWQSIQSIKNTLKREFALQDLTTSCGWASTHLNSVLMVLLKTMRKFGTTQTATGQYRREIFRDVSMDVSAGASEIDHFNEYTVVLNVADVPLQWVEVLERVDETMLEYMSAARQTLSRLQRAAERVLGDIEIVRGRSCSAIAYRGFLQELVSSATAIHEDPVHQEHAHKDVMERITVVVEDSVPYCLVLQDGRVQVPSCHSADLVLEFLDDNRERIREQKSVFSDTTEQFERLAQQCINAFQLESVTYAEGLQLAQVNRSCSELLALAASNGESKHSGARELVTSLSGQSIRIERSYGLGQDGVFTMPVEWYRYR
ncbi:hypothetical protein Poli38472_002466 [Pythium oligandrum]|uniref:DUF4460 domain-containing protein n=1 Tax=Pythium oligandrum TaxID=41045 RepID=A0A8K1FH54_PYTOL|nr:hypothetical protein Poli38472_002466 [Pythium oligandrum]|eukprot:TMW63525.1 hypothetical protein Poli38472_002466 [Pythium oligandrum]